MNQFESNVPLEKLGTSVTHWLKIKLKEKKLTILKKLFSFLLLFIKINTNFRLNTFFCDLSSNNIINYKSNLLICWLSHGQIT
jgi:hypothetical protein